MCKMVEWREELVHHLLWVLIYLESRVATASLFATIWAMARLGAKRPSAHNTDHMCLTFLYFSLLLHHVSSISRSVVYHYHQLREMSMKALMRTWYVSAQSGHNNLSWQAGWYWHYASLLTYLWLTSLPRNHDIFLLVYCKPQYSKITKNVTFYNTVKRDFLSIYSNTLRGYHGHYLAEFGEMLTL